MIKAVLIGVSSVHAIGIRSEDNIVGAAHTASTAWKEQLENLKIDKDRIKLEQFTEFFLTVLKKDLKDCAP